MKRRLLSLLVLLAVAVTGAWAQPTTLLEYGTGDMPWSADNLAEWTAGGGPAVIDGYVEVSGGNGSYATSKTIAPAANAVINVQAVWRGASSTGRTFAQGNGSYFRFGNIIVVQNDQNKQHGYGFTGLGGIGSVTTFTAGSYRVDVTSCTWLLIEMEINTASNTLTSFAIKSEDGANTYASAENVALTDADYTTVAVGYHKSGSVSTTNKEDLKWVKVTQTEQVVETADYTVKYVCDGVEVKEAAVRTGVQGADIVLNASDMANFYADGKKYIYVSNDAETKTVSNETVVTVTFREAAKYAWTARSNVGTYTLSGETFEGDWANVKYPLYLLVEGKLWSKGPINSIYAQDFLIESNNQELTLNYAETDIDNVVFYAEVEDIEGMGFVDYGNASARSSQRAAGFSPSGNTRVTTLPQGKYRVVASFYSPTSGGGYYKMYAGQRIFWEKATANANATVADVTLVAAKESNEILLAQGGATAAVDYIYIQSLGEPTADELAAAKAEDEALEEAGKFDLTLADESSEHGTVAFSVAGNAVTRAAKGDVVTITVTPADGWSQKDVTVRAYTSWGDASARRRAPALQNEVEVQKNEEDGTWTFTMPEANVLVVVEYAKNLQDAWIQSIEGRVYTGEAFTPAVVVKDGETTLTQGVDYTVTYTDNTNAGNATVTVTAVEGSDYSGQAQTTFTIAKASISVTAPVAKTLAYNGAAQALVEAGSASVGTMEYSLDGTAYATSIPEGVDAKTYTVYYRVPGDANHEDYAAQTLNVTIAANKTTLAAAIASAEDYYETIKDTDPNAPVLLDAIAAAKQVNDKAAATQPEVETATTTLNETVDAVKADVAQKRVRITVSAKSYVARMMAENRKVEGVMADISLYSVKSVTDKEVELTAAISVVGKGIPFLIYNDSDGEQVVSLVATEDAADDVTYDVEHFKGTLTGKTFTDNDMAAADHYVLNGQNFIWVKDAGTLTANRCWLEMVPPTEAHARTLAIVNEDEQTPTVINAVSSNETVTEVWYSLDGRRLNGKPAAKGVFIKNGRKVVVK